MRLFAALSIPAAVLENLSTVIRDFQRADERPRWANPNNLHVTLKFIGEVPAEKLKAIGDVLESIRSAGEVSLEFRGVGFFPNARTPNVAWIGIEASANLALLAAAINQALTPLGIPREPKAFVPHLTIARFKGTRISTALQAEIEKWKDRSFGTLRTGESHLMESRLKSSGAEYTTLRSFRFAPEEPEGRQT
jgi:RNA 2',3'-cyclic 3'-phosphodiesterase